MSEPHDPLPDFIAAIDQHKSHMPAIASWLFAVYTSFRDAGFDERQALRLAIEQWRMIAGGSDDDD